MQGLKVESYLPIHINVKVPSLFQALIVAVHIARKSIASLAVGRWRKIYLPL